MPGWYPPSRRAGGIRLLLLAVLLLGAACGGEDPERSAATTTTGGSGEATGALGVPPPRPSDAADAVPLAAVTGAYRAFGSDADPGSFPRRVRHAMGDTAVEAVPKRVVVLDNSDLEAVVALGVVPVGIPEYGGDGLPSYFDPTWVEGAADVGEVTEPNLEAIAALRPDLITGNKVRHADLYDKLTQIAPTVFSEYLGVAWKENLLLFADALGREEEAAEAEGRYRRRLAEVKAALPDPRPVASVVRVRPDEVRLYRRASFSGIVLTDLGFTRAESQNVDDAVLKISPEQLDRGDAETIFTALDADLPDDVVSRTVESPLWATLAAVRAGKEHRVDWDAWIAGVGYPGAMRVLDDIEELFSDGKGRQGS